MLSMLRGQVCLFLASFIILASAQVHAQEAPANNDVEEDADFNESEYDEVVVEYGDEESSDEVVDAKGEEIKGVVVSQGLGSQIEDRHYLEPGADNDTGVRGRVVSRSPKKVLPDAPVLAKGEDGKTRTTISDTSGAYQLLLPPGRYTLRSYYDFYHGARWDDILVTRGSFKTINFVLSPITVDDSGVEELEVAYLADTSSEEAQLNIRKEQVAVQDAVSAEEISRAGDSDASGAAKRVVGVLVDDDGRITIRGLGARYNQVLVNTLRVPSTDSDVPGVRLDTFPTDMISNLLVTKDARADLPGAFAGGIVDIETAAFPLERELKLGADLKLNTITTFRNRVAYDGGRLDWLGYDDGTRQIPGAVGVDVVDVSGTTRSTPYPNIPSLEAPAKAFMNEWIPEQRRSVPALGFSFSAGDTIVGSGDAEFGYKVAALYDYEVERSTIYRQETSAAAVSEEAPNGLNYQDKFVGVERGEVQTRLGAFASGYAQPNQNSRYLSMLMYSRTSEDETLDQRGTGPKAGPVRRTSFDFISRDLVLAQLSGDHQALSNRGLRLEWKAYGAWAQKNQPDRRNVNYRSNPTPLITSAKRFYSNLRQYSFGGEASVRAPLHQGWFLKAGVGGFYEPREFRIRRFEMTELVGENLSTDIGDAEDLFGPELIGTVSRIREFTVADDGYDSVQANGYAFAMLDATIAEKLKIQGGLRFEAFSQKVTPVAPVPQLVGSESPSFNRLDLNPLPSVLASYELPKNMVLRASYSTTVNRPDIRELANFRYTDFRRNWVITGNSKLKTAIVHNASLRWEWYFGGTDLLAVTGYFKRLNNTIEFIITSSLNRAATYANARHSIAYGTELELRFGLGRIAPALKKFSFNANASIGDNKSFLSSEGLNQGFPVRRMYAAARYVTNMSLRFDDPDSGLLFNLVYNFTGDWLKEAGTLEVDNVFADTYFAPFHSMKLIASWQVNEQSKLKFKWDNILFETEDLRQAGEVVDRETIGSEISLGYEYSF